MGPIDYELASGPYHGLGAPSLLDTTPTPSQRAARDLVVGKILEDYFSAEVVTVQSHLVDPTVAMGEVDGFARLTMERPHSVVLGSHAGQPTHAAHRTDNGVSRELKQGVVDLDHAQWNQQDKHEQAVRGAQRLLYEHIRRSGAEWFEDREN